MDFFLCLQLQGQGLGLTEMINAMAAQQHMYTAAAAYGSLEAAAYAQYPQYVAQVSYTVRKIYVLFTRLARILSIRLENKPSC